MTLPVIWIPEADADLKEALAWYEGMHPDLAIRFVMAVESAVETIAEHPRRFRVVHKQMRRAGIRRFPYRIFLGGNRPDCGDGVHAWAAQSETLEDSPQSGLNYSSDPA